MKIFKANSEKKVQFFLKLKREITLAAKWRVYVFFCSSAVPSFELCNYILTTIDSLHLPLSIFSNDARHGFLFFSLFGWYLFKNRIWVLLFPFKSRIGPHCTCVCFYRPLIIHFSVTFHSEQSVAVSSTGAGILCSAFELCWVFRGSVSIIVGWQSSACLLQLSHSVRTCYRNDGGTFKQKKKRQNSPLLLSVIPQVLTLWDSKGTGCLELVMFCVSRLVPQVYWGLRKWMTPCNWDLCTSVCHTSI